MTDSTDRNSAAESPGEGLVRVEADGVSVTKDAAIHRQEAVAVDLTLRSSRPDRCTVRVKDALPDALHDHPVEFHPNYDPENWELADDVVVYETELAPYGDTMTVYGVAVETPAQLDLFAIEPAIEVAGAAADGAEASDDTNPLVDSAAESEFSFEGPRVGGDTAGAPVRDSSRPAPSADGDAVESLVTTLVHRDLTATERSALRSALGLPDPGTIKARLDSLAAEVEALRTTVAATDRQAADVDRIEDRLEAVTRDLEATHRSLTADLEALEATVDREVRWREQLRRSMASDPDGA